MGGILTSGKMLGVEKFLSMISLKIFLKSVMTNTQQWPMLLPNLGTSHIGDGSMRGSNAS